MKTKWEDGIEWVSGIEVQYELTDLSKIGEIDELIEDVVGFSSEYGGYGGGIRDSQFYFKTYEERDSVLLLLDKLVVELNKEFKSINLKLTIHGNDMEV